MTVLTEVKTPIKLESGTRQTVLNRLNPNEFDAHQMGRRNTSMALLSIWAQLEAKPGKEQEVEEFLKSAKPLAEREPGTLTWYAIKLGPGKYGIFDTFADENGRNAHLNGEIAKALFAKAKDLLAKAPQIDKPEILASKSGR
jgi:quinol monooxygenase YgiN